MEFKDKLSSRRKELGLTLEDIAKAVGVSTPTVLRWESGKIANLRRDKIHKLANILQVSISYLMDWDDNKLKKPTLTPLQQEFLLFARHAEDIPEELHDNLKQTIADTIDLYKARMKSKR